MGRLHSPEDPRDTKYPKDLPTWKEVFSWPTVGCFVCLFGFFCWGVGMWCLVWFFLNAALLIPRAYPWYQYVPLCTKVT